MKLQTCQSSFKSGDRPCFSQVIPAAIVAATVLSIGLAGSSAQAHSAPLSAPSFAATADSEISTAAMPLADVSMMPEVASGTYLFGDTQVLGQLGREYLVMQVEGDQVVGGLYEAGADFSCFSGSITPGELNLKVQDEKRPGGTSYSVPIYLDQPTERSRFVLPYENTLGLQGTYRIEGEDTESRRVLEFCRTSQSLTQRYEETYSFLNMNSILPTGLAAPGRFAI